MYEMFSECSNLKTLDLSSFDLSKVTSYRDFLTGCTALTEIKTPIKNTKTDIYLPSGTWTDGTTPYGNLPTTDGTSKILTKTA